MWNSCWKGGNRRFRRPRRLIVERARYEISVTASADSSLTLAAGATTIFGVSSEGVTSGALARAAGIDAGAGDDYLEGLAEIDVDATATLVQSASGFTLGGVTGTGSSILAEAEGIGIDAGSGSDTVDSSADMDVNADADATYYPGATAVFVTRSSSAWRP